LQLIESNRTAKRKEYFKHVVKDIMISPQVNSKKLQMRMLHAAYKTSARVKIETVASGHRQSALAMYSINSYASN